MLKWLRKYNTFILVVGGCLLMVAWLLGSSVNELTRRGVFGGTWFKIGSTKVTSEEANLAGREYHAAQALLGNLMFVEPGNIEHWYLLTREARLAGLVGGKREGREFYLERVARASTPEEIDRAEMLVDRVRNDYHLSEDEVYQALAKWRGIDRLLQAFVGTVQYSTARLVSDARANSDSVSADFVLVPAEREMAGVPEPDEAAIKAHFDKYRDTPQGGGDFGIGYKLPARVKLAWLELNYQAISGAVVLDDVEVEKRFLTLFPDGKVPDGKNAATERKTLETVVRTEQAGKIMDEAVKIVRAEITKAERKLERDGEFLRLPSDWDAAKPDFAKISVLVASRLAEQFKIIVPPPKVTIRAANWIDRTEASKLDGIGRSTRGPGGRAFTQILFSVRGIQDSNEYGLQPRVPFPEALQDAGTNPNRYFFEVIDARKESPPDSLDEIRAEVVNNIKRLAGFEKLKAKQSELRSQAVAGGLDSLTKTPAGVTDPKPVTVRPLTVSKSLASMPEVNTQDFRDKVLAAAAGLDPMTDISKLDADKTTFAAPVDPVLSVCVYRIKGVTPLTVEKFRTDHISLVNQARRTELNLSPENNPFSFESMKKRLDVKIEKRND